MPMYVAKRLCFYYSSVVLSKFLQVFAYPGEPFKLRIIPYDEQNFTAANMFEIRGLNQSTDSVSLR